MKPLPKEIENMIDKHVEAVEQKTGSLDKKQEFALRSSLRREVARYKEIAAGTMRYPAAPKRNSPCPCESGKKYKQCCGKKSTAVRFIIVHRESDNALREEGKVLVWRTNRGARRVWLTLPQDAWYVGGMGIEKWNEFKQTFKNQYKEVGNA